MPRCARVAAIAFVPALWVVRRLHLRIGRLRVVNLVVDLDRDLETITDPPALQEALRGTLGDPSLTLAYPLDGKTFVDVLRRPVTLAEDRPGRALTYVRRRGRLVAVVEHDTVLREQQALVDAAIAAAGMAIENTRLYATLHAHLDQTRISRLRLAQTAFDERKRIQADLHDGAQQPFITVLMRLDAARGALSGAGNAARDAVDRAYRELTDALRGLREFTQGIYPAILTEHGLAAAVENLVDRAGLPVELAISGARWTKYVEVTAYFVISEALTNVYKHANATRVRVVVRAANGDLVVEITDDGRGGATICDGTGLAGLRNRVDAVGGILEIISEPGKGTTLRATIPDDPIGAPA